MPFNNKVKSQITKLKRIKSQGRLVPFIGAGFSANIGKFPTWSDFTQMLNDQIKIEKGISIDLANVFHRNWMEATEYFYWLMGNGNSNNGAGGAIKAGKKTFRELLIAEFSNKKVSTVDEDEWKQHILLINNFKKIYTTNWDICLERAAYQKGNGYKKYVCKILNDEFETIEKEIPPTAQPNKHVEIYKYHGCCKSHQDTIVASQGDYYNRLSVLNLNPLDRHLSSDLIHNHFMFLGYSLGDINVTYFLDQIKKIRLSSKTSKMIYIVVPLSCNKIDINKKQFYEEHKKTHIIPLLTVKEQKMVDKAKSNGQDDIVNKIYKQKIIEFIDIVSS